MRQAVFVDLDKDDHIRPADLGLEAIYVGESLTLRSPSAAALRNLRDAADAVIALIERRTDAVGGD